MLSLSHTQSPFVAAAPSARKALRVLYADDVKELRDLARLVLARDGHTVECVEDGRIALDRITADPSAFDVLMTDHQMPNLTGLELVTAMRTLPFEGKILVFSSDLSREVTQAYLALRVNRILFKPIFPSELRRVLAEIAEETPGANPAFASAHHTVGAYA